MELANKRLQMLASMYDSSGFGGVMVGGAKKKRKPRVKSEYQNFVAEQMPLVGKLSEVAKMWREMNKVPKPKPKLTKKMIPGPNWRQCQHALSCRGLTKKQMSDAYKIGCPISEYVPAQNDICLEKNSARKIVRKRKAAKKAAKKALGGEVSQYDEDMSSLYSQMTGRGFINPYAMGQY